MMKRFNGFLMVLMCILAVPVFGQDIHFTLYDQTPLTFNPAYTGGFYGSFRVGGIYRDQWATVTGLPDEYKTPSLYADSPLLKGFRDQDWVGVGMTLYQDRSGSLGLTNSAVKLSAAYFFSFDKEQKTVLSLGYQTGTVGQRVRNPQDATFGDELEGIAGMGESMDRNAIMDASASYLEHAGGVRLAHRMNETDQLVLGFSVAHIGARPQRLLQGGSGGFGRNNLDLRFVGQAQYRRTITDKLAITPSVFVQSFGKAREIMIQGVADYVLNPDKGTVLHGGVGYRLGDAAQIILGLDIKEISVRFGYDINISDLTPASNTVGGFEIGVIYVGKIYKRPDPDPVIFCPRF